MENRPIYTMTLAKLYASQGHLEKAAEVYQYLLEAEPDREDIRQALSRTREKVLERREAARRDLPVLLARWLDLALACDRLRKLRRLEKRVRGFKGAGRQE